tara:strand:+ start:1082 stop:1318 length:237 start_codon:yes stop_codon:yes gene_type:complete
MPAKKNKEKIKMEKQKKVMFAVREMVSFIKEEVDRSVATLSERGEIPRENALSVSNSLKMTIESAMIKASATVAKSVD